MTFKDDYKKRYKHSNTRKRYAETLIDIGSKFYFAAFTVPLAYYIKQDEIDLYFFVFGLLTLFILGFIGSFLQKSGLKIYDNQQSRPKGRGIIPERIKMQCKRSTKY